MRVVPLCVLLLLGSVTCKRKDSKRKSDYEKPPPNICDSDNRESPFACSCDKSDINAANEAKCFVVSMSTGILTLPWSQFASQKNLKEIILSFRTESPLEEFPTLLFRLAGELERFTIKHGVINEIRGYAFHNISHLQEVVLSQNKISVLHPHAFAYLNSLASLIIEDNNFLELQPMVFHHLPSLKKLFLARNNLSIVHDNAFRFLNHLLELELGGNSLSILTRETFNGLFRLQRLDLGNNKLTMLGDLTFAEMPMLQELDLDHNALSYISERAFYGLKDLNRLRLAENKLKSLNDGLFAETPRIHFLNLRDNSMQQLNYNTLQPIWENLKNLSSLFLLEGNEFPCDCHLSWVYALRNETPNKEVQRSLEELTCVMPDEALTNDEPELHSSEQQDDQFDNGLDNGVQYEELEYVEEEPKKRVLEIAAADMPCPESLVASTEAPVVSNDMPLPAGSSGSSKAPRLHNTLWIARILIGYLFCSIFLT